MSVLANGMKSRARYRVTRRPDVGPLGSMLVMLSAVVMSLCASATLLLFVGVNVPEAYTALVLGAVGDVDGLTGTLTKAAPLALGGLSAALAFRAKIWNVGQEGQFYGGAMAAYWLSSSFSLPSVAMIPLVVLASALGGGSLGYVCGLLKAKFKVDEIVSTVMFNYLVVLLLSYLLASKIWMAPGQYYMQTPLVPDSSRFPILLEGTSVHLGLMLALLAVVVVHIVVTRTTFGYELRAMGYNATTARFRGIDPSRMTIMVLVLSGALAGLGGAVQTFGIDYRLTTTSLQFLGATGIIVGVVAGMRPLGVGVAAVLFGGLSQGALFMEVMVGVSSAIVSAMQAIILIFFISVSSLSQYRIVRTKPND